VNLEVEMWAWDLDVFFVWQVECPRLGLGQLSVRGRLISGHGSLCVAPSLVMVLVQSSVEVCWHWFEVWGQF